MENQTLETEILHDLKIRSRRYFILIIALAVLFIISNILWFCAFRAITVSDTYSLNGQDNAKVIYNT